MKNKQVAAFFREIAQILELKGENLFRIRAYLKAAQNIESLTKDIAELSGNNQLERIPGVGKDLAGKISEIINTGRLKFYEQLKDSVPQGLTLLLGVPSIGPKTARVLYDKLNIKSLKELEQAALKHQISKLPGMKEKTEENILEGITLAKKAKERMPLFQALTIAEEFVTGLKKSNAVKQIQLAGSLRRKKETVRDIDILVTAANPEKITDVFTNLGPVKKILAKGPTKSSILTKQGNQVDLRVVKPKCFGAALLYFTGSKEHNIKLRHLAGKNGLKINEYGIFKQGRWLAGRTEKEMFEKLGLPFIVPELREDRGEIEAALQAMLPEVVELKDIRGDLHVHSRWSDGVNEIEEIAQTAQAKGYEYLAICDHSQSIKIAGGLSIDRLKQQIEAIHKLNTKFKDFQILSGSEVDIKSNGTLDYPDEILKQLDIVVAAIHSGFKQSQEQLTSRIISAMENRYVSIIAHPSGRLLGQRQPYALDIEAVLQKANQTNTFIEVSAFVDRLDLTDVNCQRAKQLQAKVAISTDAHMLAHLDFMHLGVAVARRGWLGKEDIINALPLAELKNLLRQKR